MSCFVDTAMRSPRPSSVDSARADPDPIYSSDAQTLHQTDSRENATRLMDDLELLRAERLVSNQEREQASGRSRSKSANRRHHPVAPPEDEFHTLTEPQIPQVKPIREPNAFGKLFKRVRKFPRIIRYFLYVSITVPESFNAAMRVAPLSRLVCRSPCTTSNHNLGYTCGRSAVDPNPFGYLRLDHKR